MSDFEKAVSDMRQAAELMGIKPGHIEISKLPAASDWHTHTTYAWSMDGCDRPINGRVKVFDEKHAPLSVVRSFVETLSRTLRESGAYEYTAKDIYFNTPIPMDNKDVWRIGGRKRHSPKNLLNDLILIRAEMFIHAHYFFNQPIPKPSHALIEVFRTIDIDDLLKDLEEYQKALE